jgi:pimeloyl-ACP methyl ester carboxylesterase
MATDTIAFLEQVVGGPAYLVGHSDGAPVALLVALERPDLVRRLVFASAVFHHDGWAPGAIDLDEETTAFFVAYHGEVSPDGPGHFPVIAEKLYRMHSEEPTLTVDDLAGYPGPTLVMVGDDDDEIPMDHTLALRRGLPRSQLAVVPGCGHGLFADKPELCNRIVTDFLTGG